MSLLGNLIWLIFGGLFTGIGYMIGGLSLCLTIIGIPFGLKAIQLGWSTLLPFGKEIVQLPSANSTLTMIFNILWLLIIGWGIALNHLIWGVNYSQLKQGAFSSPAVSKPTASLWGGLQHPQSTVTSALNNRFWCPQYNYNLKQLKLLKELSSPH
nr:YccF domain-containing protein [Thermostichus lividus]